MMSFIKASVWTASSTTIKIGIGLLVGKLFALAFGPEGVGQAANYRQLITVLGVLSGAGIFNGVTKYVAQTHENSEALKQVLGTASTIILAFSLFIAVLFQLFAQPIAILFFHSPAYASVIKALGIVQIGIAYANFFLAMLKGYRDARFNALSIIIGSIIGAIIYLIAFYYAGYHGALLGMALIPAMIVLPAVYFFFHKYDLSLMFFQLCWVRPIARQLARFTLMATITCITLPVAYIWMRNLLTQSYNLHEVGLWQAVTSISDAYLQFITASFTVYLLPTLARLKQRVAIKQEILKTLRLVLVMVAAVSFAIWCLRDWVIYLLFSKEFMATRTLFSWQLVGDVAKVGSYVFGYLIIAKGALAFYFLAEISQFILLLLFSSYFIPAAGALGATQAYMATYLTYFCLCTLCFYCYCRKSENVDACAGC